MKNFLFLRQSAGLSQQALANRFHLSQQTIYKYENGLAEPDIETLIRLASFFGVSVDYLIGNDTLPLKDSADYIAEFTIEEKDMILKVRRMKPGVRSALMAFIDKLTEEA